MKLTVNNVCHGGHLIREEYAVCKMSKQNEINIKLWKVVS